MTARPDAAAAAARQREAVRPAGPWRTARPELAIAALLVLVVTAAAYAIFGADAALLILAGFGVLALVLLRDLRAASPLPASPASDSVHSSHTMITGFWRKRGLVSDATSGDGNYDFELRGVLQHLFAARLAERYGVSLQLEPEQARRLLAGTRHDDLWRWLDPQYEPPPGQRPSSIPPRTLATIIDRLERL